MVSMRKDKKREQSSAEGDATERSRRRSEVASPSGDRGRWSSQRKMEVVLRLLKGDDPDALSRKLKVSTSRIVQWREEFLAAGQSALKSREPDHRKEEILRLKAKVGELTMDNELLYEKIDRVEGGLGPRLRRPKP